MPSTTFLHSGLPRYCICPNILVEKGLENFPRRAGTGFVARRGEDLFYITARHCLTKDHRAKVEEYANNLLVPYALVGQTKTSECFARFTKTYSLRHVSDDIPGEMIDLVAFSIAEPKKPKQFRQLISRAVKIPPSGEWFSEFVRISRAKRSLNTWMNPRLIVIGYPDEGTGTSINYPLTTREGINIDAHPGKFDGFLVEGSGPDRHKLVDISWEHSLNGFSGSPVFVGFRNENGHQYALAGMAITGGGQKVEFIKMSVITQALGI